MTRARPNRHILVSGAVSLVCALAALAPADAGAQAAATSAPEAPSGEAGSPGAKEGAQEQPVIAEPPGAAVVDTPPTPATAEDRPPVERPKGEVEMMADHPVEEEGIKFRPGRGLEINSADGDFQLRIRVRVQFLYTLVRGEIGPREAD